MYASNDLTLSMFYSSNIAEETGNKIATLTVQTWGQLRKFYKSVNCIVLLTKTERNIIVSVSSLLRMVPTLFLLLSKPGGAIIRLL